MDNLVEGGLRNSGRSNENFGGIFPDCGFISRFHICSQLSLNAGLDFTLHQVVNLIGERDDDSMNVMRSECSETEGRQICISRILRKTMHCVEISD
jgi:hypothetical protein